MVSVALWFFIVSDSCPHGPTASGPPKSRNSILLEFLPDDIVRYGQHGGFVKSLNKLQPMALLFLRIALGIIFLYHGYPKLAHPTAAMHGAFVEHGLPSYFVQVAGMIETFGGGLLILGLFARAAGLLIAIEMAIAIWKVHSRSYLTVHEYEFPLALATANFVIAAVGAGMISIDWWLYEGSGRTVARRPKD